MLRDRENAVKLLEEVKQISYEDLIRSKSGHPDHDSEEDEELDEIGYEIVLEKERKANHTMVHSRSELDMIIKADREALLERL